MYNATKTTFGKIGEPRSRCSFLLWPWGHLFALCDCRRLSGVTRLLPTMAACGCGRAAAGLGGRRSHSTCDEWMSERNRGGNHRGRIYVSVLIFGAFAFSLFGPVHVSLLKPDESVSYSLSITCVSVSQRCRNELSHAQWRKR